MSPTSKVTEPEARERRSKYPKGYSDRLLASSIKYIGRWLYKNLIYHSDEKEQKTQTLDWIGKDKVINHHMDVPYRVLSWVYSFGSSGQYDESNGNENKIIHGDNLEVLKSLLPEYAGRIRCIYIDPPYNTGNGDWILLLFMIINTISEWNLIIEKVETKNIASLFAKFP